MPKAVKEGTSYNSIASGWSPVGSFRIDINLEPGEEKEYVFIIGYAENPDDKKWESFGIINKEPAYALLEKYNTPAKFDTALAALKITGLIFSRLILLTQKTRSSAVWLIYGISISAW